MLPLVGIGELIDMDWLPLGQPVPIRTPMPEPRWLAWEGDPVRGNLLIVRPRHRSGKKAVPDDRHRRFHRADPTALFDVDWVEPDRGSLQPVGLLVAVRYRIPEGMPSNKAGSDWRHTFGEAKAGVIRQSDRYKPWLSRDRYRRLYVVRRDGNDYRLDTWLRG